MSRVTINIHDASPELYRSLDVPEADDGRGATHWKKLDTDSVSFTIFRPDDYYPDEQGGRMGTPTPDYDPREFGIALANATADALEPVFRAQVNALRVMADSLDAQAARILSLETRVTELEPRPTETDGIHKWDPETGEPR